MFDNFDHVIFDLDGTLVDSAGALKTILDAFRQNRNLQPWPIELYREVSSAGGEDLIRKALKLTDDESHLTYLDAFRETYAKDPLINSNLYPYVKDVLCALKNNGVSISLCTNKPENLMTMILEKTNLNIFFDHSISASSIGYKKPNPTSVQFLIERSGVDSSKTIFIGDSEIDRETAKAAGVEFWAFQSGYDLKLEATFDGFCFDSYRELLS